MNQKTKQVLHALSSGLLFGAGLVIGGMTDPRKVIGFLDVGGAWDPSLALVMLGAVTVHFIAYRWVRRKPAPWFAGWFAIPEQRHIDPKLVGGSVLFGVGWGLGGYCPGPGLTSLGAGSRDALVFVAAMLAGTSLLAGYEWLRSAPASRQPAASGRSSLEA